MQHDVTTLAESEMRKCVQFQPMRRASEMQTASKRRETTAPILLRGGRVTGSFKTELMDAASRAGMSANEFVMRAAAEKLLANGRTISGVFWPGDLKIKECR